MTYKQELNVLLGLLVWFKLSHAKSWYTFQDLGKRANTFCIYFVLMMMSGAWCLMSDVWYLISNVWCLMSTNRRQNVTKVRETNSLWFCYMGLSWMCEDLFLLVSFWVSAFSYDLIWSRSRSNIGPTRGRAKRWNLQVLWGGPNCGGVVWLSLGRSLFGHNWVVLFGMLCGRVLPFVGGLTLEWFFLECFVAG